MESQPSVSTSRLSPLVYPLAGSAILWAIVFAAVRPADQDFPLNDDWAFARGAMQFARGEGLHYYNWASIPQLGHWLWACPFLWMFGANNVALRISTIALSFIGLAAVYDLARQEGVTPRRAGWVVAVLAFHPLFVLMQGSFMTDVPALAMALAALALYGRALKSGGKVALAAACAVAVLGVTTRQNTVTAPLAAAILLLRSPRRRQPVFWAGVVVPVFVAAGVFFWFKGRSDVRDLQIRLPTPDTLLLMPFLIVHFLALAALPLLVLNPRPESWKRFALAAGILGIFAYYWSIYGPYLPYGGYFPYSHNLLSPWGAFAGGELSRYTGPLVHGERPLLLAPELRVFLSALGCLAGAMWLIAARPRVSANVCSSPLLVFTLWQIPFFLIAPVIYDRYLLVLLPGALVLSMPEAKLGPNGRIFSVAVLGIFALVSAGLMHDWLAWNSARWKLGNRAVVEKHIDASQIEGGFEWDGWNCSAASSTITPPESRRGMTLYFTHQWFPKVTGEYALSFSKLPETVVIDEEPYSLWLQPGRRQFYLLQFKPKSRETPSAPRK